MKIVKMRVGKVLDLVTNELLYNIEFKFENQRRFTGYSIENWKDIWDARLAIQMHDRLPAPTDARIRCSIKRSC